MPFSESTLDKIKERCCCFLYFVQCTQPAKPLTLMLFNDIDLILEYINFLKDERGLRPSTLSRIITVILNVVKYNLRNCPAADSATNKLTHLRRIQRQLDREARILSAKDREGISKKGCSFYHAHILETVKSLRCKFENAKGLARVRNLHDFLLISLFITVMPGRSKELRTLEIHVEGEQAELEVADGKNYISFEYDGTIAIIQTNFKTANTLGPVRLTISADDMLAYYLKLYLRERRSVLLGKSHNFFFVSYKGETFSSSSTFSKYLGDLFEREVAIRVSTTKLRHAIVTYFNSLDDAKDESMRESLATLMKHSVRYQKTVYNDRTHEERTELGRKFLRANISRDIFSDEEGENEDERLSNAGSDQDDLPIRVNDICALVDPISTRDDIHIFLAKVARFTADRCEAYLMHLEELPEGNSLFVLKPGKVWRESCKALVYPVDVAYNPSEKAYELRTMPEAIYEYVNGKKG